MPLDNLVCGLLETSVNKLQQLDSSAQQKRKALDGTIIGVSLKELDDLLSKFEGQADCFIHVNFAALIKLQDNHQLTSLIKSGQLEVDGDIKIVQKFAYYSLKWILIGKSIFLTKSEIY